MGSLPRQYRTLMCYSCEEAAQSNTWIGQLESTCIGNLEIYMHRKPRYICFKPIQMGLFAAMDAALRLALALHCHVRNLYVIER